MWCEQSQRMRKYRFVSTLLTTFKLFCSFSSINNSNGCCSGWWFIAMSSTIVEMIASSAAISQRWRCNVFKFAAKRMMSKTLPCVKLKQCKSNRMSLGSRNIKLTTDWRCSLIVSADSMGRSQEFTRNFNLVKLKSLFTWLTTFMNCSPQKFCTVRFVRWSKFCKCISAFAELLHSRIGMRRVSIFLMRNAMSSKSCSNPSHNFIRVSCWFRLNQKYCVNAAHGDMSSVVLDVQSYCQQLLSTESELTRNFWTLGHMSAILDRNLVVST